MSARMSKRGTVLFGSAVAVLFFGFGGGWAALAPIDGAVVAQGQLSPGSAIHRVQHLEGGIVDQVLVADGDRVMEGQDLVVIRDSAVQAQYDAARIRLLALAAEVDRLASERAQQAAVRFNHPVLHGDGAADVAIVRSGEEQRFEARMASLQQSRAIQQRQAALVSQRINGIDAQAEAATARARLLQREIASVQTLLEKGLARAPRMLGLQRDLAAAQGEIGRLKAAKAEALERLAEIELSVQRQERQHMADVEDRLAEARTQLGEAEAAIRQTSDRVARAVVRAPISGTVMSLDEDGRGSVLAAGDVVLEIVPDSKALVIELRIKPSDIDAVKRDQAATVVFSGLPTRNLQRIDAQITRVAADTVQDERTGEQYFTATTRISPAEVEKHLSGVELRPGMPAEVYIHTGAQTFLEYIAGPLLKSFNRALRES